MTVSQAVSTRIKEILKQQNITQYRLEKMTGLPKGTLPAIMYTKNRGLNLSTLIIIVRTLNVSLNEFFDSPLFAKGNLDIDNR